MNPKIISIGIEKEATCRVSKHLMLNSSSLYVNNVLHTKFKGVYSILGKLSELTGAQVYDFVEAQQWQEKYTRFKNYEAKVQTFETAFLSPKESFISKLKAEGKVCKWMVIEPDISFPPTNGSEDDYILEEQSQRFKEEWNKWNSLPDDLLILTEK